MGKKKQKPSLSIKVKPDLERLKGVEVVQISETDNGGIKVDLGYTLEHGMPVQLQFKVTNPDTGLD